jgi:hypothetical protein
MHAVAGHSENANVFQGPWACHCAVRGGSKGSFAGRAGPVSHSLGQALGKITLLHVIS